MNKQGITSLYDYDRWATGRMLETVSALPAEHYAKDLGSSHGGIHGTLVHIYSADQIWLGRWKSRIGKAVHPEELPTLDPLRASWNDYFRSVAEFITQLTDARLSAPWKYKDSKGNEYTLPLFQQMQHKVNHSSYHRGQVVTMVRQLGGKPQSTDLSAYYRLPHQG